MELMFGGMPDAGRFIIAFVLVLVLIGAGTLFWRRFGVGPLSPLGPRGRQARLAVIDAAAVDTRRRLVLIKRDNVEHLLMIGGPTDIVIESSITRTAVTSREPRPIPESTARHAMSSDGAEWTLPLEPAARTLRAASDLTASVPEPPTRTAREAMVDSMQSVRSSPARRIPASEPSMSPEDKIESGAPTVQLSATESHGAPPASEPRRAASLLESQRLQAAAAEQVSQTSEATEPKRAASRVAQSDENSLAEMAQRLEAALRRPTKSTESPAASPAPARSPGRTEPPASRKPAAKLPDQLSSQSPDLKILSGKAKGEPPVESLEDEMAKMLGRSPAK
jgi:flagellar protein FliO/FliZ